MNRVTLTTELAKTDRDISDLEGRIRTQSRIVADHEKNGWDTNRAAEILYELVESQNKYKQKRDQLAAELKKL